MAQINISPHLRFTEGQRPGRSRMRVLAAYVVLGCLAAQGGEAAVAWFPGADAEAPWDVVAACKRNKALAIPVAAEKATAPARSAAQYRFILLFDKELPSDEQLRVAGLADMRVVRRHERDSFMVIAVDRLVSAQVRAKYRKLPGYHSGEPECTFRNAERGGSRTVQAPAGPPLRWWEPLVEMQIANDQTQPDADIIVAVADDGVDLQNPLIVSRLYENDDSCDAGGPAKDDDSNGYIDDCHGWNFVAHNNDVSPSYTHGTSVAAILSYASQGAAAKVKLLPLRVRNESGGIDPTVLIEALSYAADNGVAVFNASISTFPNEALLKKFDQPEVKRMLIVAAAGNEPEDLKKLKVPHVPASQSLDHDNVIAVQGVGDTARPKKQFCRSSYADGVKMIAAPAWDIVACSKTGYCMPPPPFYKTSAAAPFVSAHAALLLSDERFERFRCPAAVARLQLSTSKAYEQLSCRSDLRHYWLLSYALFAAGPPAAGQCP